MLYSEGDHMTVQHNGLTYIAKVDWCMGDDVRVVYRPREGEITFTWFLGINGPRV